MVMLEENILQQMAKELDKAKNRIPDLQIEHDDFRTFRGGFLRIYRQGKRYRDLAKTEPSFHNLHDLRKRMKYLWYQMIILQPIFPGMLKAYADALDKIGDRLGVYHDFAELQIFLSRHGEIIDSRYLAALTDACEFKMASILHRTWGAIDNIYSESPDEIAGRFSNYWQAFRNEYRADIIHKT
jgi:CHAD domain-containing protein